MVCHTIKAHSNSFAQFEEVGDSIRTSFAAFQPCSSAPEKVIVGKGKGRCTLIQGVTVPLNCRVFINPRSYVLIPSSIPLCHLQLSDKYDREVMDQRSGRQLYISTPLCLMVNQLYVSSYYDMCVSCLGLNQNTYLEV